MDIVYRQNKLTGRQSRGLEGSLLHSRGRRLERYRPPAAGSAHPPAAYPGYGLSPARKEQSSTQQEAVFAQT